MKRKKLILAAIGSLLVLVAAALRFGREDTVGGMAIDEPTRVQSDPVTPPPATASGAESATRPHNPIEAAFNTPIQFFGVVLDQDGSPVSGAKVSASGNNGWEKGAPSVTTSDEAGKFSIQSQGIGLYVGVTKSGYIRITKSSKLRPSSQSFKYVSSLSREIHHPDPASPVVFQLRKAGPVALDRLVATPRIPRNGDLISVPLSKTGEIKLQIRCRTGVPDSPEPNAQYDWRCELSVEGGGLQEVADEDIFTAPDSAYVGSIVFDMPKSLDVKDWRSQVDKTYWVRFPDNTYGRMRYRMTTKGDHFADIEGARNPTPHARNLDPQEPR